MALAADTAAIIFFIVDLQVWTAHAARLPTACVGTGRVQRVRL